MYAVSDTYKIFTNYSLRVFGGITYIFYFTLSKMQFKTLKSNKFSYYLFKSEYSICNLK